MAALLLASCGSSGHKAAASPPANSGSTKATTTSTTTTTTDVKGTGKDPAWACISRTVFEVAPGAPGQPLVDLVHPKQGQKFALLGMNQFAAVIGVVDAKGKLVLRATAVPKDHEWREVQETYCTDFYGAHPPSGSAGSTGGTASTGGNGSSTGGSSTTTTTSVPAGASASLSGLVMSSIPGFTIQPDSVGDTGPSDLQKAIDDDGEADARTELTTDGFVDGFQRLFEDSKHNQLIIYVYRFTNPGGAQHYNVRTQKQLADNPDSPTNLAPFTVTGIPGVHAVWGSKQGSTARVINFASADYAVQVVVAGADSAVPSNDFAAALALQQFQRLAP